MKKLLSVLLFGTILSIAIVSNVSAQLLASGIATSSSKASAIDELPSSGISNSTTKADFKAAKASAKAYRANLKATSDFSKNFKDAPAAKWFVEDNVITANFVNGDIQTHVVYDKQGRWLHTMSIYDQDKLSPNVTRLIKRDFKGYNITGVQDFKEGSIQFLIVHLEDANGYKEVSVYNGEANVVREFNKR